jgi:hypothetical protein
MARRTFRDLFVAEGIQTGDGRIITPQALRWGTAPAALRWLPVDQGWGHDGAVDVPAAIDGWERVAGAGDRQDVFGSGWLDDGIGHGAALAAHIDSGAPMGISVDLDDVTVQIVDTMVVPATDRVEIDGDHGGRVRGFARFDHYHFRLGHSPLQRLARRGQTAAAGDPDVEGEIWFTFSMDEILERIVDGRLRAATACGIPAFDVAKLTLGGAVEEAPAELGDPDPVLASAMPADTGLIPVPVGFAATLTAASAPVAPPAAWFERPEPDQLTPMTITDDGQIFGHVWTGGCHTASQPGQCMTAPATGMAGYPHFHVGYVRTVEGRNVATGTLTIGGGHADDRLGLIAAREHYDDTATGFADVVVKRGRHGGWASGAMRPGITDDQLRVIRATVPSGDWRGSGGRSELIGLHWVNRPGYPVARFDRHGAPLAIVAAAAVPWSGGFGAGPLPVTAEVERLAAEVRALRGEVTAGDRARLRAAGTAAARRRLRSARQR